MCFRQTQPANPARASRSGLYPERPLSGALNVSESVSGFAHAGGYGEGQHTPSPREAGVGGEGVWPDRRCLACCLSFTA